MNSNPSDVPELTGDLKSRIVAAIRAEPTPTRRALRLRNALLLTSGAAVALAIFLLSGGVRGEARPKLLMAATCAGWSVAAALATGIALARGSSTLGRPTTWLLALLVAAPFALLAWKIAVTLAFGTEMMEPWPGRTGWRCLGLSVGIGIPLLVVFLAARRRTDPLRPRITGAALGMAAGVAAGGLVDLWCPIACVPHLLLGHILPLALLAALGLLAGRRVVGLGATKRR